MSQLVQLPADGTTSHHKSTTISLMKATAVCLLLTQQRRAGVKRGHKARPQTLGPVGRLPRIGACRRPRNVVTSEPTPLRRQANAYSATTQLPTWQPWE